MEWAAVCTVRNLIGAMWDRIEFTVTRRLVHLFHFLTSDTIFVGIFPFLLTTIVRVFFGVRNSFYGIGRDCLNMNWDDPRHVPSPSWWYRRLDHRHIEAFGYDWMGGIPAVRAELLLGITVILKS